VRRVRDHRKKIYMSLMVEFVTLCLMQFVWQLKTRTLGVIDLILRLIKAHYSHLLVACRVQVIGDCQSTAFQDGRHVASASARAKIKDCSKTVIQTKRQTTVKAKLTYGSTRCSHSCDFMIHDREKTVSFRFSGAVVCFFKVSF